MVFTGIAAFLAILLAAVSMEFGRLVSTKNRLLDELDTLLPEQNISAHLFQDITDYEAALKEWHRDQYPLLVSNAKDVQIAVSESKLDISKCQQFDGLSRSLIVYRRIGRRLGRFKLENQRLHKLPWSLAQVFAVAGVTVLASGLVLACLEPLVSDMPGNNPAFLTAPISLGLTMALALFASMVYSIFSRIASEDNRYWFSKSGLEDLKELDDTLKKVAKSVKEFREKNPPL